MTLRARLTLLALTYLVVWVIGATVSFLAVRSWAAALDSRRARLVDANSVTRLRLALSDQETGVRGYLITGIDDYLKPYRDGQATEASLLASLEHSATLPTAMARHLAATRAAIDAWRTTAAEPAIRNRATLSAQQSADIASAGVGKRLFDEIRVTVQALDADILAASGQANSDAHAALRRAVGALLATGAATGLLTGFAVVAIRRWVTVPLRSMAQTARRIRAGENATMTVSAAAEMQELATAVDEMQSTIREQRDHEVRAREAVEQNALLVHHVRRELETALGEYPTGWTVAAGLRAAEGIVAGDCYEISLVAPTTIALAVIDIAGHGAAHAITAVKCKELLRVALRSGRAPGDALSWLHQQRAIDDGFLTAFVALVNTATGRCTYANAGHPPAKLVTENDVTDLPPTGPLLGPVPEARWTTVSVEMPAMSKLAIYTDGITEARDAARGFYGEDRLTEVLRAIECKEAEPVVAALLDDLRDFSGEGRLVDDATLVVACRSTD